MIGATHTHLMSISHFISINLLSITLLQQHITQENCCPAIKQTEESVMGEIDDAVEHL